MKYNIYVRNVYSLLGASRKEVGLARKHEERLQHAHSLLFGREMYIRAPNVVSWLSTDV